MQDQKFSVLLLNLDRDTERLAHMSAQCAAAELSFSRLPGILGRAVPEDLKFYFFDHEGKAKTTMKSGELGCYASHLRAMQGIARGDYQDPVLILEDDLELPPNLKDILSDSLAALPEGWDILRLSSPARRAYFPLKKLKGGSLLVRYSKIPNSAGAYLLSRSGAMKFLQKGVRGLTFDDDLRRPWFHGMETFGLIPAPVKAGVLPSTIDQIEAGRFVKGMSSRMERLRRGDHRFALLRLSYNMKTMGFLPWLACCITNILDMLVKPLVGHTIIHKVGRLLAVRK